MPSLYTELQNRHGRYIKRKHYTWGSVLSTIADIQNGYLGTYSLWIQDTTILTTGAPNGKKRNQKPDDGNLACRKCSSLGDFKYGMPHSTWGLRK